MTRLHPLNQLGSLLHAALQHLPVPGRRPAQATAPATSQGRVSKEALTTVLAHVLRRTGEARLPPMRDLIAELGDLGDQKTSKKEGGVDPALVLGVLVAHATSLSELGSGDLLENGPLMQKKRTFALLLLELKTALPDGVRDPFGEAIAPFVDEAELAPVRVSRAFWNLAAALRTLSAQRRP